VWLPCILPRATINLDLRMMNFSPDSITAASWNLTMWAFQFENYDSRSSETIPQIPAVEFHKHLVFFANLNDLIWFSGAMTNPLSNFSPPKSQGELRHLSNWNSMIEETRATVDRDQEEK
jgi:hypothetical protein